jgi:uncharacterized membrane protein YdfJ with MMPL/SSD domain
VVLFGIGTDHILFLMFRYRERLRDGENPKQAMVDAVDRVGEVIASAAGVVIVAFLALLLSTLSVLRSIGPALATGYTESRLHITNRPSGLAPSGQLGVAARTVPTVQLIPAGRL